MSDKNTLQPVHQEYPSQVYDLFSKAEDAPNHVADYLSRELSSKVVLDIGCGTGKYLSILTPFIKRYVGLDHSIDQLTIARPKALQHPNTSLIHCSAHQTGLEDASFDAILATWLFESVRTTQTKEKILPEMNRVLKKQGIFYVVENTGDSEFEQIIRQDHNSSMTDDTRTWLSCNGFEQTTSFGSYFLFSSLDQAKEVFYTIWGDNIANRVKDKRIAHNITIYKRVKS